MRLRQRSLTSAVIGTSVQAGADSWRCLSTAASVSWPSAKMSASTITPSPTARLTGNRPPSTSGETASITTLRRASRAKVVREGVEGEGVEAVSRRLAGARATASIVPRCTPTVCRPKRGFGSGGRDFLDLVERADHGRALVLDVVHARGLGDAPRLPGADVELEPQGCGADRRRLARDLGGIGRGSEHVDQVDRLRHVEQCPIHALAEKLVGERVDGDDAKASPLQSRGDRAAGFARVARCADDGDGARAAEDLLWAPGQALTWSLHAFVYKRLESRRNSARLYTNGFVSSRLGRFGLGPLRGLERDLEHVVDLARQVERHRVSHALGHVVQVLLVALREDDLLQAHPVSGQHLLLDAADGQKVLA